MILFIKNSRIAEIKGEIWCGNGGLSLKILDPALFPPKISTKISCASNNTEGVLTVSQTAETPSGGSIQFPSFFIFFEK